MQSVRWLSVLTALIIITACFFTWVSVESKDFFIGGFNSSAASRFGKPGILQTFFCAIYILLLLLNMLVRYLLHPIIEDRFFAAHYLVITIIFIKSIFGTMREPAISSHG